jgi:penicillin-binding protein 2
MAYPPGSIFKMVTAIAAMNAELFQPYMTIEDQGVYTRFADTGYTPVCHIWTSRGMTHGSVDLMHAIAVSCNYYFYEIGYMMKTPELMDATAKALGLGEDPGAELASSLGTRANLENKIAAEGEYDADGWQTSWYYADNLSAAIGQSLNAYTPLQLVSYASTLANEGVRYKTTFLNSVKSADYSTTVVETTPTVLSTLEMNQYALLAYQEGMKLCASDTSGTAYSYFKDYDVAVAAKTGTAQQGSGGSDNASFLCYAPADDPEIAIAVYVEHGAQGGALAVIARSIMEHYFATKEVSENVAAENTVQ